MLLGDEEKNAFKCAKYAYKFCLSASISIIIYFPANGKRRKIVIFAYEMDFLCVLFIRCTSDDYAYLYGV